jgi:hypothetical protein
VTAIFAPSVAAGRREGTSLSPRRVFDYLEASSSGVPPEAMEGTRARAETVTVADPRRRRGRLLCRLTTLHPERALSFALLEHLAHEMPDIDFTLGQGGEPEIVWVCGFEIGAESLVRDLRRIEPAAFIVVTGRGEVESWEEGARAAGADFCCGWPLPVEELAEILRAPLRRSAG